MNSVLMCHAPIVIPEIGGRRQNDCAESTRAMREAARWLVAQNPVGIFLVTPHMPRMKHGFVARIDQHCQGDLGDFGFEQLRIDLPGAPEMADRLAAAGHAKNLKFHLIPAIESVPSMNVSDWPLDHGAMVPLWFLQEQGWRGPVLLIGFPMESTLEECRVLGEVLTDAVRETGEKWMLLASGDMSHRLTSDAPGGFHPRASEFDRFVVENVEKGKLAEVLRVDPHLRHWAGEDVLESLAVLSGVLSLRQFHTRVLSYEGPFGVGYLIAQFEQFEQEIHQ